MSEPLLSVRGLRVRYHRSPRPTLDGVDFDLFRGESIGILGESGAGKTTLARSLLRLPMEGFSFEAGSVRFKGTDLLQSSEHQLQKIRGAQISCIFQEPDLALHPLLPVLEQVDEVLRAHSTLAGESRRVEVQQMMASVGLQGARVQKSYPYELSGGQQQRVVIAQSLIAEPSLLIADEPTSSLDNVLQAEILGLFRHFKQARNLALIFITHNPALLWGLADRVLIMRAGRIIESGPLEEVFMRPEHAYTRMLTRSVPPLPA